MENFVKSEVSKKLECERYNPPMISKEVLEVLRSSGRSRHPSDFPILDYYLQDTGKHPFIKSYSDVPLNCEDFMKDFSRLVVETLFEREITDEKTFTTVVETGFYRLSKGYIAEISVGYDSLDNFESDLQILLKALSKKENLAKICTVSLYCPSPDSPLKNSKLEEQLHGIIKSHKLQKNKTTPVIGMICTEDGEFYLKDFYIKKDYTITDPDLHYGKGFSDFHSKLMEKFKKDSKGLVLFHGSPGTGKTFYIRSLLKDLIDIEKYVIYLPPGMVEVMIDPNMMSFISNTVMEKAEEGRSCVLLLEDAEPLLASRKHENRSGGITNLLNVTDGLLNDMLSIQVIATFNTELSNIDEALLRPERLIARKEFKKLRKEDAQALANKLGLNKSIENDSSLAEIYSQRKRNEILIHEYSQENRRIGFNSAK